MSEYTDLRGLVTFRPLERPVESGGRVAQFKASWSNTVAALAKELRQHGAERAVLEIDFRDSDFRLDGLPRSDRRAQSPGVVLSFTATAVPGKPSLRYEVGTFRDWRDNVRAIALGLQALRAVDRYGVTKRGEQYAGWRALAAGSHVASASNGGVIASRHGSLAAALKATHPDTGGDRDDYEDVVAYKESLVA